MALTIPENRALKAQIAIPSPPPFGRVCTIQILEGGAQLVTCRSRSGSLRTSVVTGVDGATLTAAEVTELQPTMVPIDIDPGPDLVRFEQSRTLVTQFTSDGTTGDVAIDMGNAPFNGSIISVQVEVSEVLVGTAALAVRSENGQSVFQGTGLTEGDVLDLEPDFIAVGLFADPLFVPVSNVPVIAGEGVSLVMRLAATVVAGAVRAFVSVTLQGVGEDLSKQILLRATVPAPPPSAEIGNSGGGGLEGIVSALVKFNAWVGVTGGVPMSLLSRSAAGFNQVTVPNLGGEWSVSLSISGNSLMNLRSRERVIGMKPVVLLASGVEFEFTPNPEAQGRRQFLTGPVEALRVMSASAEVEFITDTGESLIFGAGGVPNRFLAEFGSRI